VDPATTRTGALAAVARTGGSPFVDLDRSAWSRLRASTPMVLDAADLERVRGLGERIDLREVEEVYLPLSRLLNLYAAGVQRMHAVTSTFLDGGLQDGRGPAPRTPFVIGVAGSVAVGKSTAARLLRELLSHWPDTPRVELVTTDGFLYPNAELERRGIMSRKGFPESYDRRHLLRFVSQVKSGAEEVRAPFYSHTSYDIMPSAEVVVRRPDILIVEGLNVLQPAVAGRLALSDLFDFTVYVDARTADIENWFVERFLALQKGAFTQERSFFHRFADMDEPEARSFASGVWKSFNEPNLVENVLPTRSRATLVLRKAADHKVSSVLLRKI